MWRAGAFYMLETRVLAANASYADFAFPAPWLVLEQMAVLSRAKVDGVLADHLVTVTAPTLAYVGLPSGGTSVADDWDAGWPGARARYPERNGTAGAHFPASPANISEPWPDYPPVTFSECPPVAWLMDVLALS